MELRATKSMSRAETRREEAGNGVCVGGGMLNTAEKPGERERDRKCKCGQQLPARCSGDSPLGGTWRPEGACYEGLRTACKLEGTASTDAEKQKPAS